MRKLIDIARRASASEPEYHQRFVFETDDGAATVASALRSLNARADLRDVSGTPAPPIRFEHACLQRKCGACAMVICGVPRLACDTRLAELRGELVTLAPLRTFPVVADLIVDRAALFNQLTTLGSWLDEDAADVARVRPRARAAAFEASRCIQCGCCLEVCPNVGPRPAGTDADAEAGGGGATGAFAGMAAMVPLARLLAEARPADRARIAASYRAGVYGGCGRSLACHDICPAHIDIAGLMSRSNAVAVWRHLWYRDAR